MDFSRPCTSVAFIGGALARTPLCSHCADITEYMLVSSFLWPAVNDNVITSSTEDALRFAFSPVVRVSCSVILNTPGALDKTIGWNKQQQKDITAKVYKQLHKTQPAYSDIDGCCDAAHAMY